MSLYAIAPDLNTRLDAFAARVAALLSAHDADFARPGAVATHLDDAVEARDRADRIALTCADETRPERYAEVVWAGEDVQRTEARYFGEPAEVRDAVRLYVYWGVRKGTDDLAAEARAFRAALRSQSESPPGLVTALRAEGYVHYADDDGQTWEVEVSAVRVEDTAFRLIDHQNQEYRHEAAVTALLNGAPR